MNIFAAPQSPAREIHQLANPAPLALLTICVALEESTSHTARNPPNQDPTVTTRKKYPRLSLLGHTAKFPDRPETATLETFPNVNAQRNYWITFDCHDFTSMCPVTGQPDFARIRIEYIPDRLCIETKSLKFYLSSFRNTRAFNEAIVNRILDDLVAACRPRRVLVHGEFAPRGGIGVIVDAEYPDPVANGASPAGATPPSSRKRGKS